MDRMNLNVPLISLLKWIMTRQKKFMKERVYQGEILKARDREKEAAGERTRAYCQPDH
jgi:hypothetical protein